MLEAIYRDYLNAIKTDDEAAFSGMIRDRQGLMYVSFGRFPVLSICYLYNSKSIVKNHGTVLSKINDYTIIEEDFEVYNKFKRHAGKSLRLYLGGDIVRPLEMLAIMDDMYALKTSFESKKQSDETFQRLKKVFGVKYSENVGTDKGKLKCHRSRLSLFTIVVLSLALIISVTTIACGTTADSLVKILYGMGTESSPYLIHNADQLALAVAKEVEYIKLAEDITLPKDMTLSSLTKDLNGDSHTITLEDGRTGVIFPEISGKLHNLNIKTGELAYRVQGFNEELSDENRRLCVKGLLTDSLSGEIRNLGIQTSGTVTDYESYSEENGYTYSYFSLVAGRNTGRIEGVSIGGNMSIVGNGSGDYYFGSAAGLNDGSIINVTINEGAIFNLDAADVGAVVAENGLEGSIVSCTNNATLNVISSKEGWSILCGGIGVYNYGTMEKCVNNGYLYGALNYSTTVGTPHMGGIAAYNYHAIKSSVNRGYITFKSTGKYAVNLYVGGICGGMESLETVGVYATMEKCGSFGDIAVSTTKEGVVVSTDEAGESTENTMDNFLFAGGLCGVAYGTITKSFATGKASIVMYNDDGTTVPAEEAYGYYGGIAGLAEWDYNIVTYDFFYSSINWNLFFTNNYYVSADESSLSLATYCQAGYKSISLGTATGAERLATIEELKTKEIYFDEI